MNTTVTWEALISWMHPWADGPLPYQSKISRCNGSSFYNFIDMTATNAYILYRRMHAERSIDSSDIPPPKPKLFQLSQFQEKIVAGLISLTEKRPVGRPPSRPSPQTTPPLPCNLKPGQRAKHPVEDVRYDGLGHHAPIMLTNKKKRYCKFYKKSKTHFFLWEMNPWE